MKFGPVPIDEAAGSILGHNIAGPDGRRRLRKGRPLALADIDTLRTLGRKMVYVARLEPGDVEENEAAARIARSVAGPGIRLSGATTGRVNLYATSLGLLRVDVARLLQLNTIPGVTLATLPHNSPVNAGKIVATAKVIPYALPEEHLHQAEALPPLLALQPLPRRRVCAILSGAPSVRERIEASFEPPLRARLEALGSSLHNLEFVPLEDDAGERALAETLRRQVAQGAELVILAGETAIMDRQDIAPRAVERAGGHVACFGAPVDPGNLLMLAYLDNVPVLGAPGCVRSPKTNIVDQVLPCLLAGDHLGQAEIVALGHGGLLEDVPERPMPRSRLT